MSQIYHIAIGIGRFQDRGCTIRCKSIKLHVIQFLRGQIKISHIHLCAVADQNPVRVNDIDIAAARQRAENLGSRMARNVIQIVIIVEGYRLPILAALDGKVHPLDDIVRRRAFDIHHLARRLDPNRDVFCVKYRQRARRRRHPESQRSKRQHNSPFYYHITPPIKIIAEAHIKNASAYIRTI